LNSSHSFPAADSLFSADNKYDAGPNFLGVTSSV
jgi:hypothetical protein